MLSFNTPNPKSHPSPHTPTKSKENQIRKKRNPKPSQRNKQIISTYSPQNPNLPLSRRNFQETPSQAYTHARHACFISDFSLHCSPALVQDKGGTCAGWCFVVVRKERDYSCLFFRVCGRRNAAASNVFFTFIFLNTFGRGNLLFFDGCLVLFFFLTLFIRRRKTQMQLYPNAMQGERKLSGAEASRLVWCVSVGCCGVLSGVLLRGMRW